MTVRGSGKNEVMTEPFQVTTTLIAGPLGEELDRTRPVRFRTEFPLGAQVVSATLRVTACGVYQASINGQAVGDEVLAPGGRATSDVIGIKPMT